MALGVDDMPAGRVVLKTTLLTVGTLGFAFFLTLLFLSMRSVMDVGGFCAEGGPYEVRTQCPEGVGWVVPVSIFGGLLSVGVSFLGVFSRGGPRPYAFAWSALFLALGWNFLEYGLDPPDGGTSASWLVCGVVFVVMGGVPLALLLWRSAARWALWGPRTEDTDHTERPDGRYHLTPSAAGGLVSQSPPAAPTTIVDEPPPPGDMVDRLERLAELHERGALDTHEYEIAKDAILHDEAEP